MSAISRSSWLQLYKQLLRSANQFNQYNYREFGKRRVREYFVYHRNESDGSKLQQLYEKGVETVKVLHRQTIIDHLFPHSKSLIEVLPK